MSRFNSNVYLIAAMILLGIMAVFYKTDLVISALFAGMGLVTLINWASAISSEFKSMRRYK